MDGDREDRRSRLRSFVIGGVVGASAAFAAARRRRQVMQRRRRRVGPPGLAAFEQAPCYQELVDEEEAR
jgi:glycine/D-amino acid oxidase-like deaminating enzyme